MVLVAGIAVVCMSLSAWKCTVVSVKICAVTVAMISHTTGRYKYQMHDQKYNTISADSMSKWVKRASESHEHFVSRMCVASLRASGTHAQTLQKQAVSRKCKASIRAHRCVSKQCNMYISFCNKAWSRFCAPVVVSLDDVPEECCSVQ